MHQGHETEVEKTAQGIIGLAKSFVLADCPYLAAADGGKHLSRPAKGNVVTAEEEAARAFCSRRP